MKIKKNITIEDKNWKNKKISLKKINLIITKTLEYLNLNFKEIYIDIIYTNSSKIKNLNRKFRNKNKSTNVLSFEEDVKIKNTLIGQMVFSLEDIKKEATEQKKTFNNHLIHLFLHSFLHILGFDHIEEKDAIKMENIEIEILKLFQIENPYCF